MLRDSLAALYRKVLFLQALSIFAIVVLALFFADSVAALSAAMGGASVVAGTVVYALIAIEKKVSIGSAGTVLKRHLLAESGKLATIILLSLIAMSSGWFSAIWWVTALCVALAGHWISIFFIR